MIQMKAMGGSDPDRLRAKTALSVVGSIAATAMVAHTIIRDYLPREIKDYIYLETRSLLHQFSNQLTMTIYEFEGLVSNEIYEAAELYLTTRISHNTLRLKVSKLKEEKNITAAMERNEEVTDQYNSAKLTWIWICQKVKDSIKFYNPRDMNSSLRCEVRSFRLTFHKKHKDMVLKSYLPHVLKEAKALKNEKRTVKIFTVDTQIGYARYGSGSAWTSVNLDHPATFDTVAMESDAKEMVMKDLERFVKRKEYYRKVGKAWKRGYLLYGPPGTGKSSLIAAMANYLHFDIYDLELTDIKHNSELRKLLLTTGNRSILVVEDIDCTIDLQNRLVSAPPRPKQPAHHQDENKVTLSGFLNFIDGLWSSCGDERIIVFTTNHKEKLDPALLRPGRMDLHIHMSYCTPYGFKLLAANYLGIKEHELFGEIEDLIRTIEVTPAEIAEQLLKNDNLDITLGGLNDFLHSKTKEIEDAKAKKVQLESIEKEEEEKAASAKENKSDKKKKIQ
ncbi:hypothetical protein LguiA_005791 [Lonicera macranthoides]